MSINKNIIKNSKVIVKDGNIHIGDKIISKDDQFFYYKLLSELAICLVDRKIQDKSIIERKTVVASTGKNLVGVLFGPSDELPEIYRHRLEYYLNDWFDVKLSNDIKPKLFPVDWPLTYKDFEQIKNEVFHDLRNYKKAEGENPIESIYSRYANQHIVFYDIISIGENWDKEDDYITELESISVEYQNLIKGFFEFWENIPPRFDSHQTFAILVLKYPVYLTDDPEFKLLIQFLEENHAVSHSSNRCLVQEFKIRGFNTTECFVFPKLSKISMKDIDNWLVQPSVASLIGHLHLSYHFQDWFEHNSERHITLKLFNDLLVSFIKKS